MGYVLIISGNEDWFATLVRNAIHDAGRDVIHLRERELFPGLRFSWHLDGTRSAGVVEHAGYRARFDEIDAVLARFYGVPVLPPAYDTPNGKYLAAEWHALVLAWMHGLPGKVVNRLRPEFWYKQRLNVFELQALATPSTLRFPHMQVTTSRRDARDFFERFGGRMQYSPLTQPLNYTIEDGSSLERLMRVLDMFPLQLCEPLAGEQLSAFVIAGAVTLAGDGGTREGSEGLLADCAALADACGFEFCEVHCTKTETDWVCTGLSSMPMVSSVHHSVAPDLAAHVADVLMRAGDDGAVG